jgi:hypothetical protein
MSIELAEKESFQCRFGPDKVEVYFRRPTAKEMVRYLAKSLASQGKENLESVLEAGMELAGACILGVRDGDITLLENGARVPLVTDPGRPGYLADWKELLKQKLPGLMLMLGNHLVKMTSSELEVREKN